MKAEKIEVEFPYSVEIDDKDQQALDKVLTSICRKNKRDGQVMWPAGCGQKPIDMDKGLWDESTYFVEVYARDASPEELRRELETN